MRQLKLLIISIVACLFFSGCGKTHWPGLGGARPVPDARILIELPESLTLRELYPNYVDVASQGGFAHFYRRKESPSIDELFSEYYEGGHSIALMRWTEEPNQNAAIVRNITFKIKSNNREEPDQTKRNTNLVTFIFQKGNTEKFTKEEWQKFFLFYHEILPGVFQDEGARLSISRHPAIFTDKELLLEIREETDFEIPERYFEAK